MNNHPYLLGRVAQDHQLQLLREAEHERLLHQAHAERPSLSMRMRQNLGALLLRMSHSIQQRSAARAEAREA